MFLSIIPGPASSNSGGFSFAIGQPAHASSSQSISTIKEEGSNSADSEEDTEERKMFDTIVENTKCVDFVFDKSTLMKPELLKLLAASFCKFFF